MRSSLIPILLASVLAAAGCASTRPAPRTASLTLSPDDGEPLSISFTGDMVRSLFEQALGTSLDCDGDLDPELRSMLTTLDRRRRSHARLESDGSTIEARRRGDRLSFHITDQDDGGVIDMTMPWAIGQCLLGRATSVGEILGADGDGVAIEVAVKGDDGGRLTLALD